MSDEEKKAIYKIKRLVEYFEDWDTEYTVVPEDKKYFDSLLNLIEKQQAQIEKKDNIIYEMAKAIYRMDAVSEYGFNKEEIIEYFTKKVEKEGK